MGLTLGGISFLALVCSIGLMVVGVAKTAVARLMLVAGLGLSGVAGALLARLVGSGVNGTATAADKILGAGALGAMGVWVYLTVLLWPRLKPKGQPPTKWTKWIALAYPSVMVATGGIASAAAGLQKNLVTEGATALMSAATAVISGF